MSLIIYVNFYFSLIIFVIAVIGIILDFLNYKERPIFFSPWIFPILTLDPKNSTIKSINFFYGLLYFSIILLFVYSALLYIWVNPAYYGIILASLTIVIATLISLFFVTYQQILLAKFEKQQIFSEKIIKNCWLDAKLTYYKIKSLEVDEEITNWKFYKDYIKLLKLEIEQCFHNNKSNLKSLIKKLSIFYSIQENEERNEIQLLILFNLLLIKYGYGSVINERMKLINFVQNYKSQLFASDIYIIIDNGN